MSQANESRKSRVFVASSVRGLDVARAIRSQLKDKAKTTLWNEGIFAAMSTPLQDLLTASRTFDFAVFVFHPDDEITIRDKKAVTVRDNVLFELGLFIGSIGKERCIFVTPEKRDNLRIPTDLAGITPAEYDADNSSLDAAVGDACYRIGQQIDQVGPLESEPETILYSSRPKLEPTDFRGVEGKIWKDDKPISAAARGRLCFPDGATLRIERENGEGKFEIHLRPEGREDPSFPKKHDTSYRRIRVRCEVSAEGGGHTLAFVLKDEDRNKWLDDKRVSVTPGGWQTVDLPLKVPSNMDLLFRIDDLQVSGAPSAIAVRNLIISERD